MDNERDSKFCDRNLSATVNSLSVQNRRGSRERIATAIEILFPRPFFSDKNPSAIKIIDDTIPMSQTPHCNADQTNGQ